MDTKTKAILQTLISPRIAIPAGVAASAGASIYGNLLDENQLEKGDNRLITESLLSGVGAGVGLGLGYKFRNNPTVRRKAADVLKSAELSPQAETTLRNLVPLLVGSVLGSTGASVGSGPVANIISGQANLLGLPSFSGRQNDYYEEDYKVATDNLTEEDIFLLKKLIRMGEEVK